MVVGAGVELDPVDLPVYRHSGRVKLGEGAVLTQTVADPTHVWTEEELIEVALDAGVTAAPGVPGYSNTNYTILGLLLEATTCQPIEDILSDVAVRQG